jgi:hypothetical protein
VLDPFRQDSHATRGVLPVAGRCNAAPGARYAVPRMPASWIWMQIAIVIVVLIGMVVAITKLA